jgi:hypothetical protein
VVVVLRVLKRLAGGADLGDHLLSIALGIWWTAETGPYFGSAVDIIGQSIIEHQLNPTLTNNHSVEWNSSSIHTCIRFGRDLLLHGLYRLYASLNLLLCVSNLSPERHRYPCCSHDLYIKTLDTPVQLLVLL